MIWNIENFRDLWKNCLSYVEKRWITVVLSQVTNDCRHKKEISISQFYKVGSVLGNLIYFMGKEDKTY